MSQQTFTASPPTASQFPVTFNLAGQWRPGIRTIEVDNATALTLTVVADGAVIRTVPPYVPRFNVNTGGGWQTIQVKSNGAAIQTTDTLTIIVYDQLVVPPLLPSFGPAAWGGGAVPNSLTPVSPGDAFSAWQIQQLINLLTGVMTGQNILLGSTLPAGLPSAGVNGQTIFLANPLLGWATLGIGATGNFNVGYNMYVDNTGTTRHILTGPGALLHWTASGKLTIFAIPSAAAGAAATFSTIFSLDVDGTLSVAGPLAGSSLSVSGQITSPATGASGKPLLNFVPVSPPVQTLVSGTGNTGLIQLPVSGLPNSAVYADFFVEGSMSAGGAISFYGPNGLASPQSGTVLNVGTVATAPTLGFAMAPSSAGHVGYQVSGVTGAWSFTLTLNGYFEPS